MSGPLPLPRVLLVAALLLAPAAVTADPERAIELLQRMASAPDRLSYEGTFVYMRDGHVKSMRILHSAGPDGEKERLLALDGPRREVVREDGKVVCLVPDDAATVVNRDAPGLSLPVQFPEELSRLRRVYRLGTGESTRIAEHRAQLVTVEPVDDLRYGHRFWVAPMSGLLLQAELVNGDEVIERVLFTSLQVKEHIPAEQLLPQSGAEAGAWELKKSQRIDTVATAPAWRVTSVPNGFELEFSGRHTLPERSVEVEHMVFSDGLASVSVFVEPAGNEAVAEGLSQIGAVHAFSRSLSGQRVTAVGEVPAVTVRRFAEAIERGEP